MSCFVCSQGVATPFLLSGKQICKRCYEASLAIQAPQTTKRATHTSASVARFREDERSYWRVACGDFVCIIDYRDAASEAEALTEALSPLTRWYFEGASLVDSVAGHPSIRRITHNEFCDWLRKGHAFALPSTTKNST